MFSLLRKSAQWMLPVIAGATLLALFVVVHPAEAQINPLPKPDPIPGSYGLQATKTAEPPTEPARITTPGNGGSYTESPITIGGTCSTGLLVQIYNNGVMVGSVICENGSFSLQISLFSGVNEITAAVFDDLEQEGPESNLITVTYTDTSFEAFGELITLTSAYGRRSAAAGTQLSWPLQLSGGTGPYAFSIDWGDGSDTELKSQALPGNVDISHVYRNAGIYRLNITVTDVNGVSAFLQLVAVSNGQPDPSLAAGGEEDDEGVAVAGVDVWRSAWIPVLISVILLAPTFWLGRRSQVISLRHKLLRDRANYKDE